MKLHVIPGQTVQLTRCPKGQPGYAATSFATVSTVHHGMFSVPDVHSTNGLARVVCHNDSKNSGSYWYEYRDKQGQDHSEEVIALVNYPEGSRIIVGSFFE